MDAKFATEAEAAELYALVNASDFPNWSAIGRTYNCTGATVKRAYQRNLDTFPELGQVPAEDTEPATDADDTTGQVVERVLSGQTSFEDEAIAILTGRPVRPQIEAPRGEIPWTESKFVCAECSMIVSGTFGHDPRCVSRGTVVEGQSLVSGEDEAPVTAFVTPAAKPVTTIKPKTAKVTECEKCGFKFTKPQVRTTCKSDQACAKRQAAKAA